MTAKHIILHFPTALVLWVKLKAGLLVNLRCFVENPEWGISNNTG